MQPGYYWAYRIDLKQWMIVEVVGRLHDAVLDRGYAVKRADYSAFVGPLTPPPSPAWLGPHEHVVVGMRPAPSRRAVTEE